MIRPRTWKHLPGGALAAIVLFSCGCPARPPPGPAWPIDWRTATVEEVRRQIAAGHDVNAEADFGETMLMQAAATSTNPAVIDAMVACGAKIEARSHICDYTVLMEAVTKNPCAEITDALLRHGANLHARDDGGYSVLMLAAGRNPNPEVIDLLVRSGADPNAVIPRRFRGAGDSALWFACSANPSADTIECLIRNGAKVGASDRDGRTALWWAAGCNTPAVAELLLKHGADVNAADECGETPLIRASWNTNALMTRLLLDDGARVDAADRHGTTALMRALWPGMAGTNAIRELIEREADVNARDRYGRTALMYGADACLTMARGPDGIALLLAHGADALLRDAGGKSAADRLEGATNTTARLAHRMLAEAAGEPPSRKAP